MDYFVYLILCTSIVANLVFAYLFYKKKHILTVDAKKVLADLFSGTTVLKVDVLDTTNLMYRSPRQ